MDLIEDPVLYGGYAVQIFAHLVLLLVSLTRLPRVWAVLGSIAGLLGVVALGWYLLGNLVLRFSDDGFEASRFFYGSPVSLVAQMSTVVSVVLLVAAVVSGRREEPTDHSGPTGTTFRQLPGGVRWE